MDELTEEVDHARQLGVDQKVLEDQVMTLGSQLDAAKTKTSGLRAELEATQCAANAAATALTSTEDAAKQLEFQLQVGLACPCVAA